MCPEDKDGFEDEDGCPELDNDKDGIADTADQCPNDPETYNGVKDDDGCADTGGTIAVQLDGDRVIMDRVPAMAGRALAPGSVAQIEQLAAVMVAHDEVTRWLIVLAQPTEAAANALATEVRMRLLAKGVAAERVEVVARTGPAKAGGVVQERAAEVPIPACPAGREVQQRPAAKKPEAPQK